ncbi:MAG: hypothetical protein NTW19_08430 [Planctomycetota bacterium]|nr:hypothetical protein [Planctomycetota bacterium]
MSFILRPAQRSCVASRVPRASARAARESLLDDADVQRGFVHTATPMPAFDDTAFRVMADRRELIVAVHLANSMGARAADDSIEIFIDPLHDHLGFFQFIFTRQSPLPQVFHHLPYGDAASTAFRHIQVRGFAWGSEKARNVINQVESYETLHVRFGVDDVFRNGPVCGFNVCRYRPAFKEASSWNLCAGNGFVDATSLGHHPLDRRVRAKARIRNGRLSAALPWPKSPAPGRHRLYLHGDASPLEPGMFHFDLPPTTLARRRQQSSDFALGMFYDIPDDLRSTHFSPDRLAAEMDLLRAWGIRRVSWIDYGPTDRSRSFWEWASSLPNARRTMAECGDMLPLAARQCRERGMTCYGVVKPFDMGFSEPEFDRPAPDRVPEVENRWAAVLDEVAANPSSVMTANPAWERPWTPPITRLRVSSQSPLPPLGRAEVELLVSDDNRRYAVYRGRFALRQGTASVPHVRHTPAGLQDEPGRRREHFLELTGLALRTRYAAIRFKREGVRTGRSNPACSSARIGRAGRTRRRGGSARWFVKADRWAWCSSCPSACNRRLSRWTPPRGRSGWRWCNASSTPGAMGWTSGCSACTTAAPIGCATPSPRRCARPLRPATAGPWRRRRPTMKKCGCCAARR